MQKGGDYEEDSKKSMMPHTEKKVEDENFYMCAQQVLMKMAWINVK